MVKKQDVSDWIETAMKQDIDGFQAKNPGIKINLDLVPGFCPSSCRSSPDRLATSSAT